MGTQITLRPISDGDLQQMEVWLCKERILKWYNDADEWLAEIGQRHGEFAFLNHFIALADGLSIGFGQWYDCFDAKEEWYEVDVPGRMFSIDYLVGEDDYLGRGYGTAIVGALLEDIGRRQPDAVVVVQPDLENLASGGALLANGFVYDADREYFRKSL